MLSLLDILRAVDAGTLSPDAALARSREAIRSGDDTVRSVVHLDENAQAGSSGPLRGVAVGVKDIIDVAGLPTRIGSPIYDGWVPRADAAVTALLRRAGATPLAKTATTPFAYLDPVETRNPRAPGHTPGGSSSGSAAAVAAGFLPLALGTQTGGSVVRPASFCGVAAIKPTYGLLPMPGVKCYSWSLDTLGLFAAGVADLAEALAAVTGRKALRLPDTAPGAPRFGLVTQDFAGDPEPAAAAALEEAVRRVERGGASVRPISLPAAFARAWELHGLLQDYEARQALAWEYDHHRDLLPPLLQATLDTAQATPAAAYDDAQAAAREARGALGSVFQEIDAILTFAAPGPPPHGLGATGNARYNRLWTLMGTPCVAVPGLTDPAGLPIGIQVIGPAGQDGKTLDAARYVEGVLR